jgi:adenylosuccinate synthase
MPYHPCSTGWRKSDRADDGIGTTLRGNGPAYADKVARRGIRVGDLLDRRAPAQALARSARRIAC